MTILSAQTIRRYCRHYEMVSPFAERTVVNGKTHGLSAAGYDVRVEFNRIKYVQFEAPRESYGHGFRSGHTFMLASTVVPSLPPMA